MNDRYVKGTIQILPRIINTPRTS